VLCANDQFPLIDQVQVVDLGPLRKFGGNLLGGDVNLCCSRFPLAVLPLAGLAGVVQFGLLNRRDRLERRPDPVLPWVILRTAHSPACGSLQRSQDLCPLRLRAEFAALFLRPLYFPRIVRYVRVQCRPLTVKSCRMLDLGYLPTFGSAACSFPTIRQSTGFRKMEVAMRFLPRTFHAHCCRQPTGQSVVTLCDKDHKSDKWDSVLFQTNGRSAS
jgi:hypothetical protein